MQTQQQMLFSYVWNFLHVKITNRCAKLCLETIFHKCAYIRKQCQEWNGQWPVIFGDVENNFIWQCSNVVNARSQPGSITSSFYSIFVLFDILYGSYGRSFDKQHVIQNEMFPKQTYQKLSFNVCTYVFFFFSFKN